MTAVIEREAKNPTEATACERLAVPQPAPTDAGGRGLARAPDGARRCLVCGELKPRDSLIRFVIGPDRAVVPDLAENLPGHGLWVSADAAAIALAAKKNLFAKAAKEPAKPDPELAALVARLLRKRCLDLMGLAKSAGIIVLGEAQTEAAMRAGKLDLHLQARDAARALDNRNAIDVCDLFARDEMGPIFGYDQIVYAGLLPHKLTQKLRLEIARLRTISNAGKNEGIL